MNPCRLSAPSTARRKRPRPAYSCIECTRRKLRCSKQIPCSACIERGIEQLCRRRPESESVAGRRSCRTTRTESPTTNNDLSHASRNTPASVISSSVLSPPQSTPTASDGIQIARSHAPLNRPRQKPVENIAQDAAVMLEFLALNRQRVIQVAKVGQPQHSGRDSNTVETFDPLLTLEKIRAIMLYHEESISWIHNVVHLPTFRKQCEQSFADPTQIEGSWVGLYYAMLAVSL